MNKQQGGFTLIELVMVIVILGILAATALPRFSNLSVEARSAAANGVAAGLRSGAAIAHATALAKNVTTSGVASVTVEGSTSIALNNGYPSMAGIQAMLVDTQGFTASTSGSTVTFNADGTTANCYASYTESVGGAFPIIATASSGC